MDGVDYQVVQTFFSWGGVYSGKYGLYYALYFRYLNYGCVLWGNYYLLDPESQLVKLQNEVVRNANNVMTSWQCDFFPIICDQWPNKLSDIVKLNTCQLQCFYYNTMWLLASPGPRGSEIFAPFWGQVTKPLFLSCMIVSSAVRDYFAR